MKGKIRKNKRATIGFDGKKIQVEQKRLYNACDVTHLMPRDSIGAAGCFRYRKMNGAP